MTEPLVSYVIITRNRRGEVVNCLKSLRQQDYPNKQIIVIDNGSNDDSASAIRQDFPEALLIKLETNHGVSGGRNRGAAAASGEICVFIDDDAQLADRQATRRIIRYFDDDPNLACLALKVCDPVTGNEDYRAMPRADKRRVEHDYQCAYFAAPDLCSGATLGSRSACFGNLWSTVEKSLIYPTGCLIAAIACTGQAPSPCCTETSLAAANAARRATFTRATAVGSR
jgi:glycosyltransferase involved in cell wall biosynthesis